MTKKYEFSEPRLADHGGDITKRWYIDYQIFDTDKQDFVRKRYTGMNKYKTLSQRRKASLKALDEITALIESGYTSGKSTAATETENKFDLKQFTLKQAVVYFLNYKNSSLSGNEWERLETTYNKGVARVSENTLYFYFTFHNTLFEWLEKKRLNKLLFKDCTLRLVNDFFTYLKEVRKVDSKTHNNYRGTFSTLFNFYIKHQELEIKNPLIKVESLSVESSEMHMPFTNQQLAVIQQRLIEKGDKQLLLFINFIYYTFVRINEELRPLQVKDIREKTIYIPAGRAKNNKGEHILIHEGLEALIQEYGLRNYPKDYYVFSTDTKPGEKMVGVNYFYKKHRKLLSELGLTDESYTLYGYKHTGAINLYKATKDILVVQRHCRHSSSSQTETYLRKYGVIMNEKALQLPKFGHREGA